jgi:PEP-CTERM motif
MQSVRSGSEGQLKGLIRVTRMPGKGKSSACLLASAALSVLWTVNGGTARAATLFSEDFSSDTTFSVVPTNWTVLNTASTGAAPRGWTTTGLGGGHPFYGYNWPNTGEGNFAAATTSGATSGATVSERLITPQIQFSGGDAQVSFYAFSLGGATPSVSVELSTTGTTASDFSTTLLTINPANAAKGYPTFYTDPDLGAFTPMWTQYIARIPAALVQTGSGYLAFDETGTTSQASPTGIDSVTVSSVGVTAPQTLIWNDAGALNTAAPAFGAGILWDTTSANWYNGIAVVAYNNTGNITSGDTVIFNDANDGVYGVTVSGTVSPASTTFNNSLGSYNLIGANASSGISGSGALTLTGTLTVALSTNDSYTGGTNVSSGTLVLNSANAFPSGTANIGTGLIVSSTGTVRIASHGTNPTYVPIVSSLTNSGTIDLTNNAMIIRNGTMGTIAGQIASAYNGGAWNGSSGTGVITSSLAASTPTHLTAVGVESGITGTFEGVAVTPLDVLVKYTYYGDANLDGQVTSADYTRIDAGYLSAGTLTGWQNGDFNYDHVINGSDYTLIDNAFNTQGAILSSEIASASDQIAAPTAVPEPTAIALFGIGVASLLGRRRHR